MFPILPVSFGFLMNSRYVPIHELSFLINIPDQRPTKKLLMLYHGVLLVTWVM